MKRRYAEAELAQYVHGDSAWHAHQGQRVVESQQALPSKSRSSRLLTSLSTNM